MAIYDRRFFAKQQVGSLESARVIVPLVMQLVQPRSVVDFGCGVGTWLRAFLEAGVERLLGLDGDYVSEDQLQIAVSDFRAVDLQHPPKLAERYDLAVCLEVGEHLPHASAAGLVEALVAASSCVLFSAALPGQGGKHHINENWPGFWRELFTAHDFHRLDPIRPRIWREPSVAWWYKQNVYLYASSEAIAGNAALQHELACADQYPFELIHLKVMKTAIAHTKQRRIENA